MPTPCLSYAVRAAAGIIVTVSHNPAKYNGYKAYGTDGCRITMEAADAIVSETNVLDTFEDVRTMDFDEGRQLGRLAYISGDVYTYFVEEVKRNR